jgi:hypothetical protein
VNQGRPSTLSVLDVVEVVFVAESNLDRHSDCDREADQLVCRRKSSELRGFSWI